METAKTNYTIELLSLLRTYDSVFVRGTYKLQSMVDPIKENEI